MTINVDRYSADSKTLVCELTPFFLRGKKLLRILAAICAPLDTVNQAFQKWAMNTIVEAATTSQIIVLKWSMKNMLQQYFENENDEFVFYTYGRSDYTTVYETQAEQLFHQGAKKIYMPEDAKDDFVSYKDNRVVIRNREELKNESNDLFIVAPAHNHKISDESYAQKIRQCIEPYLAYDNIEYQITIKNNS